MLYAILERTSYTGYFCPLSQGALELAELVLTMKHPYYTMRARVIGTVQTYSWNDAQRIIRYWQSVRPSAEYQLLAYVERV
jgi:hypothetical protein